MLTTSTDLELLAVPSCKQYAVDESRCDLVLHRIIAFACTRYAAWYVSPSIVSIGLRVPTRTGSLWVNVMRMTAISDD